MLLLSMFSTCYGIGLLLLYESDDRRSVRGVGRTIALHIGELQGRHNN
jgi:hypothetical protein